LKYRGYLGWVRFAQRGLVAARGLIGFVLPKSHLRPGVGKNLQPHKLQGYSIWLCFAKTGFGLSG
jgi:hypothetical protein